MMLLMKNLAIVIVLSILMAGNAIAEDKGKAVTPGEYQLTFSQPTDSKVVKNAFKEFGVIYILSLGRNIYLMRLDDDPGKNRVEFIAKSIPNFRKIIVNNVYKIK